MDKKYIFFISNGDVAQMVEHVVRLTQGIRIDTIRTKFESLIQKMDGLRSKKPKTMNL